MHKVCIHTYSCEGAKPTLGAASPFSPDFNKGVFSLAIIQVLYCNYVEKVSPENTKNAFQSR